MAIETFTLILQTATSIAPNVKHFVFSCDKPDFRYIPGQFITLHFDKKDGQTLKRSYSIATIAGTSDAIEFAAGYIANGPASELLFGLQPGDRLTTSGPFGRLVIKDEGIHTRYILVATSTGVTPYRCMIPQLKQLLSKPNFQIVMLQGVQYHQDLLYKDDFLALAEQYPNFSFYACYSREKLANPAAYEHSGYVQTQFPDLNLNPANDLIYLCGNPGMIDESFEYLKTIGFDVKNIRREKYISSK